MTRLPSERIDFENIDSHQIQRILKTGDLSSLSPGERRYYDMMEMVRGLRARMLLPGGKKIVTKAGIIKLLKSEPYGLTDWMARRVFSDSLNFFYADDGVSTKAWANFYADRLDKLADLAISMGKLKEAKGYIAEAAKLRGCYDESQQEIPPELLDASPIVIYSGNPEDIGAPRADREELERFIDDLPDTPEVLRDRAKEDAGIKRRNLLENLMNDAKEYGEQE